jgi:plastocyanin
MKSRDRHLATSLAALFLVSLICPVIAQPAAEQGVTFSGVFKLADSPTNQRRQMDYSNGVVWLKPVAANSAWRPPERRTFKIVQQNKRFNPHVLSVPVGSRIEFPNLDHFFHNVFSLFDGKRFDLGLYEGGGKVPSVSFDRPGICYVFCNIHPEMSAVIVVMDTDFFTYTDKSGRFVIPHVPPGKYQMFVWHERLQLPGGSLSREITVRDTDTDLGPIFVLDTGSLLENHKNKFGFDYEKNTPSTLPYQR